MLPPLEPWLRLLAGVLGDARPAAKLRGELPSARVQLVALERGLPDLVLEVSCCRRCLRDAPLRDRCAVACANVEPLRLLCSLGSRSAVRRLRLLQHPLCRRGLRSRPFELGNPSLALGGKPSGECFEFVHPGTHRIDVAREPVEISERCPDLLVGALQLPEDREDPFGHYDGVTR